MTTENIFEQASRLKLRFESTVGLLSVEDLWSLPLTSASKASLDSLAVALNKALKGSEESFVVSSKKDEILKLKFDVVKHIIDVRVAENQKKTEEVQRKAKLDNLNDLIARKENQALENLSLEELRKLAAEV